MNPKLRILTTLLFCLLGLSVTALGLWGVYVVLAEARDEATRATERIARAIGKTFGKSGTQGFELARLLVECTVRLLGWFLRLFLWWAYLTQGTTQFPTKPVRGDQPGRVRSATEYCRFKTHALTNWCWFQTSRDWFRTCSVSLRCEPSH